MTLTLCCVFEARQDVVFGEVREIVEDFLVSHPGGQIAQHVINRDAHPANAGLATALARLDRDDILVTHGFGVETVWLVH